LHVHLKTGIKERESIPGLELGIFDFSFRSGLNDPNFIFVFLTKEISKIGQLSLGWYWGNGVDLRDEQGLAANRGLLASLRRPLSEWTSDLEILGEFISGTNRYSSGSAGLAWSWNPKSQLKSFYVWPLNRKLVGEYMSVAISVEY
jgi:hypothetical protein